MLSVVEGRSNSRLHSSFIGVNCYRSSDFVSWERVGHVLSPQAGTNISSSQIVERPKVIYNEKNKEYVMWFHGECRVKSYQETTTIDRIPSKNHQHPPTNRTLQATPPTTAPPKSA
jgi:hypothetical protein